MTDARFRARKGTRGQVWEGIQARIRAGVRENTRAQVWEGVQAAAAWEGVRTGVGAGVRVGVKAGVRVGSWADVPIGLVVSGLGRRCVSWWDA